MYLTLTVAISSSLRTGYGTFAIESVAARAGVAKSTIYGTGRTRIAGDVGLAIREIASELVQPEEVGASPTRSRHCDSALMRHGSWLASGLLLGTAIDALAADPRAAHPVAAFGSLAARAENRCWADTRGRGALYAAACVGPVTAAGWALQWLARGSQARGIALTAAATWTVLGAASLAAEATGIQLA